MQPASRESISYLYFAPCDFGNLSYSSATCVVRSHCCRRAHQNHTLTSPLPVTSHSDWRVMDWSCIPLHTLISYIFHERSCWTHFDESFCWHTKHLLSDFVSRHSRFSQRCFTMFISLLGSMFSLPLKTAQHSETSATINSATKRDIVEDLNPLISLSSPVYSFQILST
jgi:hypothetical protein